MNNSRQQFILTEEEYRKKVLSPLYESKEPREVLIEKGRKQVEELLTREASIKELMKHYEEIYRNV